MQTLRKIFFYAFTAIYVVFCPLLILYALGYIYTPGPGGEQLVTTGLIYIDTAPQGADVYLDFKPREEKTPLAMPELLPGSYRVTLKLEGYKEWQENVPVEAEKATVLDKVLLIPEKWEEIELLKGSYSSMIPIRGLDFIVLGDKGLASSYVVYDYTQDKSWPLIPEKKLEDEEKIEEYFIQEKSPYMLLYLTGAEKERYLWVNLEEGEDEALEVTELFPHLPDFVQWETGSENLLFTLQNGYINKIDIKEKALYPEIIKKVQGFGVSNGDIYALLAGGKFIRTDSSGKNEDVLLDDEPLAHAIFGQKTQYDIKVFPNEVILFFGSGGELVTNRLPYNFVDKGLRGLEYDKDKGKALVWTKEKIGCIDFTAEETGKIDFEKGPSMRWLYTGTNIGKSFWAYEGSHVLFDDDGLVHILELEEYGMVRVSNILGRKTKEPVYFSEKTGEMYFIGEGAEGLKKVVIIPEKSLFPVTEPTFKDTEKKGVIEPE